MQNTAIIQLEECQKEFLQQYDQHSVSIKATYCID